VSTQNGFAEFFSQGASGSGVYMGLRPGTEGTRLTDLAQSNPFVPAVNALVHYGITYDRTAGVMRCYIAGGQACAVPVVALGRSSCLMGWRA
jgi:hypothetical protein